MEHVTFTPKGVCAMQIDFDIEDGKLHNLKFIGGCNGNLQGIASLVKGMKASDIMDRLNGIRCGYKNTSCPDQLCRALEMATRQ